MYRFLLIVLCAAGLAGCSHFGMGRGGAIDPLFPQVSVVEGRLIVVNQEPIVVKRGARITWQLPGHADLSFEGKGIEFTGSYKPLMKADAKPLTRLPTWEQRAVPIDCSLAKDAKEVQCSVSANAQPGQYAYVIRVRAGGLSLVLDPPVMIDG